MGSEVSKEELKSCVKNQILMNKNNPRRTYLTVSELLNFTISCASGLNFKDPAVLFLLDYDLNGRFTFDKLTKFFTYCYDSFGHLEADDIRRSLIGVSGLVFAESLVEEGGVATITEWMLRMVEQEGDQFIFQDNKQEIFLSKKQINCIYEIFGLKNKDLSLSKFIEIGNRSQDKSEKIIAELNNMEAMSRDLIREFITSTLESFKNAFIESGYSSIFNEKS